MSRTNPSIVLTLEAVDGIVDRLLKGKYEKRPPTVKELWRTGLYRGDARGCRNYIADRWPDLTRAGLTMRANKMTKLMDAIGYADRRSTTPSGSDPDNVWQFFVRTSHYERSVSLYVVGPGGTGSEVAALRQRVWLLYGWLWSGSISDPSQFIIERVGMGGQAEANHFNTAVLESVQRNIRHVQSTIEEHKEKKAKLEGQLEALTTMSVAAFANADF